MDTAPTTQEILNRMRHLPVLLQDAALSEENALKMERITAEFQLTESRTFIARLAGRVLLGFLSPNHLVAAFRNSLGIEQETARALARRISQEIFLPVREELVKLYSIHLLQERQPPHITPYGIRPSAPLAAPTPQTYMPQPHPPAPSEPHSPHQVVDLRG